MCDFKIVPVAISYCLAEVKTANPGLSSQGVSKFKL
jgi:hypothetical protein